MNIDTKIIRIEVRHIVLRLKLSEEEQKKRKTKLANVFRTIKNYTFSKATEKTDFASFTKQILTQLKKTDELNKSIRTILCELLVKISELKHVNTVRTDEIPVVNKKWQTLRNISQISNIQQSHHIWENIHPVPLKCVSNTEVREIHPHDSGNMVSTYDAIQEKKFKGENLIIRFGIRRKKLEKNLLFEESAGFERSFMRDVKVLIFFHILPEFKKIKCKIK